MAVDTRNKRASCLSYSVQNLAHVWPNPDGSLGNVNDRQHMAFVYAGTLAAPAGSATWPVLQFTQGPTWKLSQSPKVSWRRYLAQDLAMFNLCLAVTPSNSVNLRFDSTPTDALYVGGTGNVAAVLQNGSVVVFVGVIAGEILPVKIMRVNSTNTTATSMVALYI